MTDMFILHSFCCMPYKVMTFELAEVEKGGMTDVFVLHITSKMTVQGFEYDF
jgi:hypothetical protein